MPFKLKNWKLALLALLFISLLTGLGCWQLSRAKEKKVLMAAFAERMEHQPLGSKEINESPLTELAQKNAVGKLRYYRAELTGTFDNAHTILLDNKIFHRQVGYEVFTPFHANGITTPILIDRGFIPLGANREKLPDIKPVNGTVTIMGLLNLPATYVALGQMNEQTKLSWPLRVEFIDLTKLANVLGYPLFPYIIHIDPKNTTAYAIEWQVSSVGPERHLGYAVQWFALALTLLIIFIALNRDRKQ